MQGQVKYHSEVKTASLGGKTITIENLTPVLSPKERERRNGKLPNNAMAMFFGFACFIGAFLYP